MADQRTPENVVHERLAKEKEDREKQAVRAAAKRKSEAEKAEQERLARLEEAERIIVEALPKLLASGLSKARLLRVWSGSHNETCTKRVKHWWGSREESYSTHVDDFKEVAAWELRDNNRNVYWLGRDGALYRSRYYGRRGRYFHDIEDVLDAKAVPLHKWDGYRWQEHITAEDVRCCVARNT